MDTALNPDLFSDGYGGNMELYKIAGVDMSTTDPIEDALAVLEEYVDRLGVLTGK